MASASELTDAVVIGGGFYGCSIATYLAKSRGLKRVILLEQEASLMTRASFNNQARVHNGYHYPRSFTTAFRSRTNLPHFVRDWERAIKKDFVHIYAIAKRNSKVSAKQFERFCKEIGAPLEPTKPEYKKLFENQLIEKTYQVEEYAFDAQIISEMVEKELKEAGVTILLNTRAEKIDAVASTGISTIITRSTSGQNSALSTKYIFNCTYSALNHIEGSFFEVKTQLKHEIAEMPLIELPKEIKGLGITVMDGPFFSIMPFPARNLHSLSHVRYTPHFNWVDEGKINPSELINTYKGTTRIDRMMRDVARYFPKINEASYINSIFEIKTVLMKNEGDDGRPILFQKHTENPNLYSVLGGKIDNIYDVLEKLDNEIF